MTELTSEPKGISGGQQSPIVSPGIKSSRTDGKPSMMNPEYSVNHKFPKKLPHGIAGVVQASARHVEQV